MNNGNVDIGLFEEGEYLYFYQKVLTPERLQKEIDFLVAHTHLDRPLKILDLACGHGRHANPLAVLGHSVTGIDMTKNFLEIAKKDAQCLGVKVDYIHADMRELDYKQVFDRIYVLFTAIGYFEEVENTLVFQKIFESLKPGGIFCFDSHNRDTFMANYQPTVVVEREGNWMIDQLTFDGIAGRCHTIRTIIKNNSSKKFEFSIRLYSPTEIVNLFNQIGFSSVSFYDWDGKPLQNSSKRMVVVAKK